MLMKQQIKHRIDRVLKMNGKLVINQLVIIARGFIKRPEDTILTSSAKFGILWIPNWDWDSKTIMRNQFSSQCSMLFSIKALIFASNRFNCVKVLVICWIMLWLYFPCLTPSRGNDVKLIKMSLNFAKETFHNLLAVVRKKNCPKLCVLVRFDDIVFDWIPSLELKFFPVR